MCTSPLLIKNKKFRHYDAGKIYVPCGECEECMNHKASSIYIRARYEYDACIQNGGCGFMCCLTYDNIQVPSIVFNGERHLVFNKAHVIAFIKRLRTNLQRECIKRKLDCPLFKYVVTSEFGTDPNASHRPHYHLLFFFRDPISPVVFSSCFNKSRYIRKGKNWKCVFGFIRQCSLIDPKKGGIHYCSKYVCKDITFKLQNDYLRSRINVERDKINQEFGIILGSDFVTEFRNKCIRQRKDYKDAVRTRLKPYKYMLQFYMLSNDLGGSAYLERYGDLVLNMPVVNIDDFTYSVPKTFCERIKEKYGLRGYSLFIHNRFMHFVDEVLSASVLSGKISLPEKDDLKCFASKYVMPHCGGLKLVLRNFDEVFNFDSDWKSLSENFKFFTDNDFFDLLYHLERCFRWYSSEDNRKFRFSVVHLNNEQNNYKQIIKNRNKFGNYVF